MKTNTILLKILLFFISLSFFTTNTEALTKNSKLADNVILFIADDLGPEHLAFFNIFIENNNMESYPQTPVIDSLIENGISFPNFYTNPTCSATRVSILTGRYGFRTGVGCPAGLGDGPGIVETEMTIPKALNEYGIKSAIYGKWHMSKLDDGYDMPNKMGFHDYRGLFEGAPDSYYKWDRVFNATKPVASKKYITTSIVEDATEFLEENQENPFFLWVALITTHTPVHKPPKDMLYTKSYKELDDVDPLEKLIDPIPYYHAMIESMDYAMGQIINVLKDDVKEKTSIIFISDNGIDKEIVALDDNSPYDRSKVKETVYEAGVRMPLVISGPGIEDPGRFNHDLVNSVDLYATICNILGVDVEDDDLWDVVLDLLRIRKKNVIDSISLINVMKDEFEKHERSFALSEQFGNCVNLDYNLEQQRTIRNSKFKYIKHLKKTREELYDLEIDPLERNNLLDLEGRVIEILDKYYKKDAESNLDDLKELLEELLDSED